MKVAAAHNLPFGDGPKPSYLDLPRYLVDATLARARRRNPPVTPWWRRYAGSWQVFESELTDPRPVVADIDDRPLVYGLCGAWNEDDVIYATVANLYLQGVDEVIVLDDDSDDETAAEAKAAGATVVHDASDGIFEERRRAARINELIDEWTDKAGRPVWWVVVDADEFPRGPAGTTIAEYLRSLPSSVTTVGSRVLEHYPGSGSAPRRRHHPLDELPRARWHNHPACPAGHWKHQVMLARRPGELRFMPGRHTVAAPDWRRPVVESVASLLMHHFPLRDKKRTEEKFRAAASVTGRYTTSTDEFIKRRLAIRLQMLDLVYADRYDLVPNMFPGEPRIGTAVHDWRDLVPERERVVEHQVGASL